MTDQLPAAAREASRSEVRRMIAGLLPGQTGINFADEIADAALDAAWPHLRPEPEAVEFCGYCHRSHLDCHC